LGLSEAVPVVLAVTKLSTREAPLDLIAAAGELHDVQIAIAGDGPMRGEVARLASACEGRVHLLGYVPYPELPALYAASDLFVHPVREERWGVSVAEAMAAGLPVVVSSRVGSGRDLIVAGRNGFTYDAGDPQAIAARIREALQLSREDVASINADVLRRWDYASTWSGLLRAAEGRT
jgi:glycosyltransferase involved in cell wall biosynthesis